MIALPAAADQRERIPAVPRAQRKQTARDIVDRFVPRNAHEAAIRLAPQRVRQAVVVILVVGKPRGLLAQIALRDRMLVVTANLAELAAFDVDDKAAIA